MRIFNIIYFLCLLSFANAFAQSDTTDTATNKDSVNTAILKEYQLKLAVIDSQRVADSLQRADLENRLQALKNTDNLKKEDLLKQLNELNQKESQRLAEKKAQIDSLRKTAIGYPVKGFFNDTLFLLYNRSGSFSAEERADAISLRIRDLSEKFVFQPDTFLLIETENSIDIVFGDIIIMNVSQNDALWNDKDITEQAEIFRDIISNSLQQYKTEISITTLAREIGLALLVLLVIVVLIIYTNKLFRWTALKIQNQKGQLIKGLRIKNYTLFDAGRLVEVLLSLNTMLKWLVILITVYIALPILFGIFPWTKDFAEILFGYILNPVKNIVKGLFHYLPNMITILVVLVVFRYLLKGVYFLKTEIEKGHLKINGFYADWASPTYQIVRILIIAFMIVVIFPYLPGSDSPVFQGVSVFLGFIFTFGSAGSLSNIIAGLVLTYMRLFKIGDRVKIGEVTGDVIEKSLLVTRIRTIKNEIISIPNSTVMNSHTINYSSDAPEKGLIIHTTVTIGYDVPWKEVYQALIEAANRTSLTMKYPEPFVLQTSLDDFYVSYQVNAYIQEANKQAVIYSDLHQNIQDVFNEKGIEILSPHFRAARDGNKTTIPESYLPPDYKIPGFNVNPWQKKNNK